MKRSLFIPMLVAIALAVPAAWAQQAGESDNHHPPDDKQIEQRFDQMDQMMDRARHAHGAERHRDMQAHMTMMQEQMQAMHGMMGSGMGGQGMMSSGMHGQGMQGQGMQGQGMHGQSMGPGMGQGAMPPDAQDRLNRMQSRMDMMQRMMEQMVQQQQMMMGPTNQ